jgi:hypothetical protein
MPTFGLAACEQGIERSAGVKRFTDAIANALADKNWLAAAALSLTMPDVCGGMEHPKHKPEKRYKAWWDRYMLKHCPKLSGADAYALRCAYLHEGGLHQRARKAVTHFHFVVPKEGPVSRSARRFERSLRVHRGNARVLQVDTFCRDMIDAVDKWSSDVRTNQAVQQRLQSLLEIYELPTMLRGTS